MSVERSGCFWIGVGFLLKEVFFVPDDVVMAVSVLLAQHNFV
jgi:hypothetical protein